MIHLHKMLCAITCVVACAGAAPAAVASVQPIGVQTRCVSVVPAVATSLLADSWSWRDFWKFWKRQLDKTAGVVGVVLLVGAGAVLLILSKTRR